jgi:predicted nucleotidyltransferase
MGTDTLSDCPGAPKEEVVSELVRRLVQSVDPLRIVLFGSAARREMGPDSDLDVLVIVRDGVHRRRTAQAAYRSLKGIGLAKDVIVVTESDVRKHSDNPSLVLCPALRQGREIYHAAG